jgi:regulator of sigma E protease
MQMDSKLFVERFPFVVRALDTTNLNAKKAGILKGDRILTINNDSAAYFHEFVMNINKHKDKTVEIGLLRAGEYKTLRVPVSSEGTVGLAPELPDHFLKFDTIHYGFFESFVKGTEDGVETIDNYIKQFKLVFTKEGAKHIGGFASIGGLFPKQWDLQAFLGLTAFLSMVLAFMNILPIPALDGGHIMFLLYEVIFRRKPSEKFMEYAQYVGMALLLSLLLFANGNDAYKGISQLFK